MIVYIWRLIFASVLTTTLSVAANCAPIAVPTSFGGTSIVDDPANGFPRYYQEHARYWATKSRGWTTSGMTTGSYIVGWQLMNQSAGTYDWGGLDTLIRTNKLKGVSNFVFTAGGTVPGWVATGGAQGDICPPGSANGVADFETFVTALFTHEPAGSIQAFEPWNEANYGSGWLTCPAFDSQMASLSASAYAAAKASDPNIIVLSNSMTAAGDPSGVVPLTYLNHFDLYLQACAALAAGSSPKTCFDVLNRHSYLPALGMTSPITSVVYAPELFLSDTIGYAAVAAKNGYGSVPIWVDEGYAGSQNTPPNFDNDDQAAVQAKFWLLHASAGVPHFDWYGWLPRSQCIGTSCTTAEGTYALGMNRTGAVIRNMIGWLAGATFTSPIARITGTNVIRTAPGGSGVTTGKLSGPGTGCSGAPSGTGSLGMYWSTNNTDASYGISFYVTGYGTDADGVPYNEFRVCGTISRTGSGISTSGFSIDTGLSASLNQSWTFGVELAQTGGSYSGIYLIGPQLNENNSTNSYLGYSLYGSTYPVNQSLSKQRVEFRTQTTQATVAYVRPTLSLQTIYNNTGTGISPIPIDFTFRIGAPTLELNENQWVGTLVGADGNTRYVAWDAACGPSSYTVATGYNFYRDKYNVEHQIAGNVVTLTCSPILIEQKAWKGILN